MKILRKLAAIMTAAALALGACTVSVGAVSIEDTAKTIALDSTENVTFNADYTNFDYKIEVKQKGTLSIKINSKCSNNTVYLFDEDCANVCPNEKSVKTGGIYWTTKNDDSLEASYEWNSESQKIVATTSYAVEKGTYYLRITNTPWFSNTSTSYPSAGKATISIDFTKANNPVLTSFQLTMKKGSTIQLDGVFTIGSDTITWKSSKNSVATVSSKGKVTAKKKGTTTITATCGDVVLKIKIKVTG